MNPNENFESTRGKNEGEYQINGRRYIKLTSDRLKERSQRNSKYLPLVEAKTLGSGGFGKVFSIEKSFTRDPDGIIRMKKCSLAVKQQVDDSNAQDEHKIYTKMYPNASFSYVVNKATGISYMIEPRFAGKSLQKHIDDETKLTDIALLELIQSIIIQLQKLHSLGLVHLDIKPANIMFSLANNEVNIIDFGLAKKQGENTGYCGTRGFIPPELKKPSQANYKMDIYSLGITINQIVKKLTVHPSCVTIQLKNIAISMEKTEPNARPDLQTVSKAIDNIKINNIVSDDLVPIYSIKPYNKEESNRFLSKILSSTPSNPTISGSILNTSALMKIGNISLDTNQRDSNFFNNPLYKAPLSDSSEPSSYHGAVIDLLAPYNIPDGGSSSESRQPSNLQIPSTLPLPPFDTYFFKGQGQNISPDSTSFSTRETAALSSDNWNVVPWSSRKSVVSEYYSRGSIPPSFSSSSSSFFNKGQEKIVEEWTKKNAQNKHTLPSLCC